MEEKPAKKRRGRFPKPIVAIDDQGNEFTFETVMAFMRERGPLPGSLVQPAEDMPNGWGRTSRVSIQRVASGRESAYGGWRFRYVDANSQYAKDVRERQYAESSGVAVPKSTARRLNTDQQREADNRALMDGTLGIDEIKAVLRRKYGEVIAKLSDVRAGKWTPPRGWSAKEEVGYLKDLAKVYGIDWTSIADTRTDADKVRDAVERLEKVGPASLLEETDEVLDAVERSILSAVNGCKAYIHKWRREADACPDHVKARFNPDGSWKQGESFTEEDEGDADLELATEMAKIEGESVYLDEPDVDDGYGDGDEDEDDAGEEEEVPDDRLLPMEDEERPEPVLLPDESQRREFGTDNGGDSSGAGVDRAPGGEPDPPAPESFEDDGDDLV